MKELIKKSYQLRLFILDLIMKSKTGHIGGDFSVLDILIILYFKQMNISVENMNDPNRDMFVLSKGHSVEAYYSVLALKGFFSFNELYDNFSTFGSKFIGHPNNKIDGIEMNSGSLGHGLPVCVGMAISSKMDKKNNRIYTVMGDGELAEGSVWEGFMSAGHFHLDNLCAVVDRNELQISGPTEEIMSHEDLANRIKNFNWNVIICNGNDMCELNNAFNKAKMLKGKPTCIIAKTVKGFGGGQIMENKISWHHHVPSIEEYEIIKNHLMMMESKCDE